MLHTKFQDHRTFGSGEDFYRFLPYIFRTARYRGRVHILPK